MSRGKQIFVRMNPDDYELVQAEAARTGKSDAAVLRDAFLGRTSEEDAGFEVYRRQRSGRSAQPAQAPTRGEDPMAEVFLCETGQLTDESRQALREAGIVVVEVKDPSRCRFIRSGETLSSGDMLWAAMNALGKDFGSYSKGEKQREQFAFNVVQMVENAHKAEQGRAAPGDGDA